MRTETIDESVPAVLKLSPDQAKALEHAGRRLASSKWWWGKEEGEDEQSTAITCRRESADRWRVTVANAVGLIAVEGLQIAVRPKIPVAHLFFLLEKSGRFPRLDNQRATAATGEQLWPLVATWFVASAEAVLRRDLVRDYAERTDDLRVVRGRVDPLSMVKSVYTGTLEFSCEFDEFVADTALNRLLKEATRAVASSETLGWDLRRRARLLVTRMEEVSAPRPADFWAETDRRTAHYADAVALGRHVLLGRGRVLDHGEAQAWTFLIPTPVMVEEGIRRLLAERLSDRWHVEKKGISAEGARMTFNPDLVFGRGVAIADVKYRLSSGDITRGEVEQAVTFATAYRCQRCAVISFWRPGSLHAPRFSVGRVEVTRLGWRADASLAPVLAAEDLVRDVDAWLGSRDN